MKLTKEIKTAILVISSIILFIWGYSFLKGKDLLTNYNTYFVEYNNVEGLSTSSIVTINGKNIGKVIDIQQDKNWKNIVKIQIDGELNIAKSSIAEIYAPSPIGGKQIAILPGSGSDYLKDNDYIKSSTKLGLTDEISSQLTPLKDKIEVLLDNANAMLVNVNQVLDDKSKENLRNSLTHLNVVLAEFSKASKSVNTILDDNKKNINSTMNNLEKTASNFSKVSDSLSKISIGETVKNLENTLLKVNGVLSDLQSGKGTLGKLMKDDQMYANLNRTSKELELLLQDLRLNPTRYINVSVFGKKNKPYIAPDEESNEPKEE